jgi:hypothetical protein
MPKMRSKPSQVPPPALPEGQIMHGNQPGVATATPDPGTMKILDRHPSERAAGEAAFRGVYGRDPMATDYEQWKDPFPGVPQSSGGTGNLADLAAGGGAAGGRPSWGSYMPEGYNPDKIAKGHGSPKYRIGETLSQFDFRQGITPEVLAALKGLGLSEDVVLQGKDKIQFTGKVDPRFEGYTTIDVLRGANGPGGPQAWQYGAIGPANAQGITPAEQRQALLSMINPTKDTGPAPVPTDVRSFGGERRPTDVTANIFPNERDALAALMQRG